MGPRIFAALAISAVVAACAPTFVPDGMLSVGGADYRPTACSVLIGATGGIALVDPNSVYLALTLPPAHLQASQEISGIPHAKLVPGLGKPEQDLGPCGTLTLSGEAFHGAG